MAREPDNRAAEGSRLCQRSEAMIETLAKRVDLRKPLLEEDTLAAMDGTTMELGSLLLALGHVGVMRDYTPPHEQAIKLVRLFADYGDYAASARLIQQAVDPMRKELLIQAWQGVLSAYKGNTEGLERLPDPPNAWWAQACSIEGDPRMRQFAQTVVNDRPHLLGAYMEGVLNGGALHLDHARVQAKAWKMQPDWHSMEGWTGSVMAVGLAGAAGSQAQWMNIERRIIDDLPHFSKAPESGPLSNDFLADLAVGACEDYLKAGPNKQLRADLRRGKPKSAQQIQRLHAHWEHFPRGVFGERSRGLTRLAGRAMVAWGGKHCFKEMLPLMRANLSEPWIQDEIAQGATQRLQAHAFSARLLTEAMATVTEMSSKATPEEGDALMEYALLHFLMERLGRGGGTVTPRQQTIARDIQKLCEQGHGPQWEPAIGQVAMALLALPFVDTPPALLASLQHQQLQSTPAATSPHRKTRL